MNNRLPAEWEKHDATWLAFPCNTETWRAADLVLVQEAWIKMVDEIRTGEQVNILMDFDSPWIGQLHSFLEELDDMADVHIHDVAVSDCWIRDYGPTFIQTEAVPLVLVNWMWSAWGNRYPELMDDGYTSEKIERILRIPRLCPHAFMEGGAFDVNGNGSVITTDCILKRNPNLTQDKVDIYFQQYLGATASTILVLEDEYLPGDDTDGHVDNIARFTSERSILHTCDEESHNYNVLRNSFDIYKREYWLTKFPVPEFRQKASLPASYLNFYIANDVVLVPTFDEPNDEIALDLMEDEFPTRRIVGIRSNELVQGFGGVHCMTQQQPIGFINPDHAIIRDKPERVKNVKPLRRKIG